MRGCTCLTNCEPSHRKVTKKYFELFGPRHGHASAKSKAIFLHAPGADQKRRALQEGSDKARTLLLSETSKSAIASLVFPIGDLLGIDNRLRRLGRAMRGYSIYRISNDAFIPSAASVRFRPRAELPGDILGWASSENLTARCLGGDSQVLGSGVGGTRAKVVRAVEILVLGHTARKWCSRYLEQEA